MLRRKFLTVLIRWFKVGLWGAILYPAFAFVVHKVPRLPVRIRVRATPGENDILVESDFFLLPDIKSPRAISRRCTHLGCRVNYDKKKKLFICPCHDSRYTLDRNVVRGPAQKDLQEFPVTFSKQEGYIVELDDNA